MANRPHSICYIEIPAPGIEASEAFYQTVFGWEIERSSLSPDSRYSEFRSKNLRGGLVEDRPVHQGGVLLYMKVGDIDACLQSIAAAGGSIVRPKFEIGAGHGFSALFRAPAGNELGLVASS